MIATFSLLIASGCSEASDAQGAVVVFAASSLTDAFKEIGAAFTESTGVPVTFNFAASNHLASQILDGAPAAVFAAADLDQMARVAELTGEPVVFATTKLGIAVAPGNPLRIESLSDLARPGLVVILASPQVPAGRYAETMLDAAGITISPSSLEPNVRAALTRVELGEADASVVYLSNLHNSTAQTVFIPDSLNVTATFPAAALRKTPEGMAFLDYLISPAAGAILRSHGFDTP